MTTKEIINNVKFDLVAKRYTKELRELLKTSKEIEEKEKQIRKALAESMEKHGIEKAEIDGIRFTYKKAGVQQRLDSAKIKKEFPFVAEQCTKEIKTSASVIIKDVEND